jgi:hypothetical protein
MGLGKYDPSECSKSVGQLRKEGRIGQHCIPTYRVLAFPDNDVEWAARDAILTWPKRRIPNVRRRYHKPHRTDQLVCRAIPEKHRPTFYALREINRLWRRLAFRLEGFGVVSTEMADAMLSCPPAGYLVEHERQDLEMRFCRHRMCPWCHYRMVVSTLRSAYDNLLMPDGTGAQRDQLLTTLCVRGEEDVSKVNENLEPPKEVSFANLPLRWRRRLNLHSGLTACQIAPDFLTRPTRLGNVITTPNGNKGVGFYIGMVGVTPDIVTTGAWRLGEFGAWLYTVDQRPITAGTIRFAITRALAYPHGYLTMIDPYMSWLPQGLKKHRRVRLFGNWTSWDLGR